MRFAGSQDSSSLGSCFLNFAKNRLEYRSLNTHSTFRRFHTISLGRFCEPFGLNFTSPARSATSGHPSFILTRRFCEPTRPHTLPSTRARQPRSGGLHKLQESKL